MKKRVLIADRDDDLCDLLQQFLSEQGYQVETTTDGLDCLAKLLEKRPDILVLDLELFWGRGDEVLAWLRQGILSPKIPVLLTATVTNSPNMAEFGYPMIVDYLLKPFPMSELVGKLRCSIAKSCRRQRSNRERVLQSATRLTG